MADNEAGAASKPVWAVLSLSGIGPPGNRCHSSPASSPHSPSSSLRFPNTRCVARQCDFGSWFMIRKFDLSCLCLRNYGFVEEGIALFAAVLKVSALLVQTYFLRGVFDAS